MGSTFFCQIRVEFQGKKHIPLLCELILGAIDVYTEGLKTYSLVTQKLYIKDLPDLLRGLEQQAWAGGIEAIPFITFVATGTQLLSTRERTKAAKLFNFPGKRVADDKSINAENIPVRYQTIKFPNSLERFINILTFIGIHYHYDDGSNH